MPQAGVVAPNIQGDEMNAGKPKAISVLFICLGNICRSPMGQAVFQHLIAALPPSCPTIDVDSAGTDAYHSLEPPDPRTIETLEAHGIHDFDHAARKVTASDFEKFDFIFAMDRDNLKTLKTRCRRLKLSSEVEQRISLFGDWDPTPATDDAKEIDDPWCWLRDTLNVDVIIDKRSGKVSVTDLNETQSS